MSYDTRRYNIPKISPKALGVEHCGITVNHPGHVARSILSIYSAHFILSGCGTYTVRGKEYRLHAGQGFMILPYEPCIYTGDETEPWAYIYANFSGSGDAALAAAMGIDAEHPVYTFEELPSVQKEIQLMFDEAEKESCSSLSVTAHFLMALSQLVDAEQQRRKVPASDDEYVNKAFEFIRSNYPYKISIGDLAKSIGIERSYLHRVFKRATGDSPEKYITSYRLERAKEMMLALDGATLTDIAIGSGFYDISHFSRVFRQKYGVSPGRFMKEEKP